MTIDREDKELLMKKIVSYQRSLRVIGWDDQRIKTIFQTINKYIDKYPFEIEGEE